MIIPKLKLLILDVDGTMTDNGIYIDEKGIESKKYNAKDGVGIYELIKNNVIVGIISHSVSDCDCMLKSSENSVRLRMHMRTHAEIDRLHECMSDSANLSGAACTAGLPQYQRGTVQPLEMTE